MGMKQFRSFAKFRAARRGASAVSYIVLCGVVALGAFAGFQRFGQQVGDKARGQGSIVDMIGSAVGVGGGNATRFAPASGVGYGLRAVPVGGAGAAPAARAPGGAVGQARAVRLVAPPH